MSEPNTESGSVAAGEAVALEDERPAADERDQMSTSVDLSDDGIALFLHETDPRLLRAVERMENSERWAMDHSEEVHEALMSLATALDQLKFDELPMNIKDQFIQILGYCRTGRALRLLLWIGATYPQFVSETLIAAQTLQYSKNSVNNKAAATLLDRFTSLERIQMLSRIFSRERLKMLTEVLRILTGAADPAGADGELEPEAEAA